MSSLSILVMELIFVPPQNNLILTLELNLNFLIFYISVFDASVRSPTGIESGILYHFGHYDQCLHTHNFKSHLGYRTNKETPVQAKYCLVDVKIEGLTTLQSGSREKQPLELTTHWGVCIPAACRANDVAIYLQHTLQRNVTVNDKMCQYRGGHELHISEGMFIYALFILFFLFLAILSTLYHIYLISSKRNEENIAKTLARNEILNIALLSFSIIENIKKLFQASKDQLGLNSINGIKALAMLFILAGHVLSFIYGSPVYNQEFIDENIKSPMFGFLSNSLLFVDVFLLLSGFLFCRILLIELERRKGKLNVLILYVGRYIRLTPAYLAIIGFYITWFPSIGSGPLWQQRIEREQERCQLSWWSNILYINNYIGSGKLCMFQSWYLSVDSQLFFMAPIVIYLLNKSRKHGLNLLLVLVAVTSVIPFVVTYLNKLDPTLMIYPSEVADLASNVYYSTTYIKTHMRASAYVIGVLTGYLVHLMQAKSTKLPKWFVRGFWLFAIFIGVASMFSVTRFYVTPYNNLESTMYAGFHKLGWNVAVAWLVLSVTTGHAPGLQKFLSSRAFAPISRLTYCAYLSNGIVELYYSSSVKVPSFMGYLHLSTDIFGHILDTFLIALILCLLFESPIHALERILMSSFRKTTNISTKNNSNNNNDNQTPSTSEEQVA
ncbi:nose resistant to fluoxetine protein 6-like [Lucilia cuprina]|uniref:nose resistant to fluoxetine protein 6-like n=1 Tax=Lucilia cuprina TaxID=7375 RepID=UPI001F06756A|nr:nose resistant to fluoxetine protein 6-like [Lucilia cuprina]